MLLILESKTTLLERKNLLLNYQSYTTYIQLYTYIHMLNEAQTVATQ